jgi:hypothetical protein
MNTYIPPTDALVQGDGASTSPLPGHLFIRTYQIKGVGTSGANGGSATNEMVGRISNIDSTVCAKINQLLAVTPANTTPPTISYNGGNAGFLDGTFQGNASYTGADINGKFAFCGYISGIDPQYGGSFFQVLISR